MRHFISRFSLIALTCFSAQPVLAQADAVTEAEQNLALAKASLAEAEMKLAKAKRIVELKRELAELEGGVPVPTPSPSTSTASVAAQVAEVPATKPQQQLAAVEAEKPTVAANAITVEAEKQKKIDEATKKFGGLELGAGLSFTLDVGDRDRVTEAEYVNSIVRIKDADNVRARLMFESHYFFKPKSSFLGLKENMWGVGPFVAIQPGSDEIIEAIGMGLMLGFRRAEDEPQSFNIGVGMVFDPNTQVLGDGILPNQPLPAGETDIRYKQDSQAGVMVIASFTF